ncbi:MAG: DUF2384 domain-containing protein [Comamonadaceae bacterium]|nr:MAG: DUF2384 domain-containing protein [Comamonadaceae bacterium]
MNRRRGGRVAVSAKIPLEPESTHAALQFKRNPRPLPPPQSPPHAGFAVHGTHARARYLHPCPAPNPKPMPSHMPSPADIEAEIQRLIAEREALEQQRQVLRVEELKVLADAYARKLQAAGFTIREGLDALKPYARVRLASEAPPVAAPPLWRRAAAPSPLPGSPGSSSSGNAGGQDLNSRAAQVLGDDAQRWLRRPHPLLGGQSPQQVAGLPGGLDKVHALLAAYARGA